jgi:hypothetical protein
MVWCFKYMINSRTPEASCSLAFALPCHGVTLVAQSAK